MQSTRQTSVADSEGVRECTRHHQAEFCLYLTWIILFLPLVITVAAEYLLFPLILVQYKIFTKVGLSCAKLRSVYEKSCSKLTFLHKNCISLDSIFVLAARNQI